MVSTLKDALVSEHRGQPWYIPVLLSLLMLSIPIMAGCPPAGRCLSCGSFDVVGRFADPDILECSGMAASRTYPGILWVHNDSGDRARVFAVTEQGILRGVYMLQGALAVDWEDIALAPCSAGSPSDCLYIGDIGDNANIRSMIRVYRIQEPTVPLEGPPVTEDIHTVEVFECRYPDSPHDAETLVVDPQTAIPYVITKEAAGYSTVYRFPQPLVASQPCTLETVARLTTVSYLTGGDVTPNGSRVLLRNKFSAFEYPRLSGQTFPEIFGNVPCTINLAPETQGEALALVPSGRDIYIYTASEGLGAPINRARCSLP